MLRVIKLPFSLIALFLWMMVAAICCWCNGKGRGWAGQKNCAKYNQMWGKGMAKIMGLKLQVHDESGEPIDGCLIVSNHTSYLDIFSHSALALVRIAAKAEIRRYPLVGAMVESSTPIWVDRTNRNASKKTMEQMAETLDNGLNLLVYPEGTTSDGLSGVRDFKSTAFEVIVGHEFAIQPIVTIFPVTKNGINPAWFGDQTLVPHLIKVLMGKGLRGNIYILPKIYAKEGENRKELTLRVHDVIDKKWHEVFNSSQG